MQILKTNESNFSVRSLGCILLASSIYLQLAVKLDQHSPRRSTAKFLQLCSHWPDNATDNTSHGCLLAWRRATAGWGTEYNRNQGILISSLISTVRINHVMQIPTNHPKSIIVKNKFIDQPLYACRQGLDAVKWEHPGACEIPQEHGKSTINQMARQAKFLAELPRKLCSLHCSFPR